jgi:peptidase S58-like protein
MVGSYRTANGETTGTTWIEEPGFLAEPVFITNTHRVETVRDAFIYESVRFIDKNEAERSGRIGDKDTKTQRISVSFWPIYSL